jgi:hypothetical protein
MIDPNFQDPEQQSRVYQQKMEALKLLMSEIIDNPNVKENENIKKVIDYLDSREDNETSLKFVKK